MPKVDGVKFPYTKAGMQKAKAWSEMTGKPMKMEKKYQEGGYAEFNPGDTPKSERELLIEEMSSPEYIESISNLAMGSVGGGGFLNTLTRRSIYLKNLLKNAKGSYKKDIQKQIIDVEKRITKETMQSGRKAAEKDPYHPSKMQQDNIKKIKDLKDAYNHGFSKKEVQREIIRREYAKKPQKLIPGGEYVKLAKGGPIPNANQTAWDSMMGKKYTEGGQVTTRDTRQVLDPSSLEEVAWKPIEHGQRQAVRYKAKTKGGEDRHIVRDIAGLTNKEWKRQMSTMGLRDAIKNNPGFADTLSAEEATNFMNMDDEVSIWDLLKKIIPSYEQGGEIPAGRRMYGTNPKKKKKAVMQTSTAGMHMRGGEQFKKGGKVKMPKGWHV